MNYEPTSNLPNFWKHVLFLDTNETNFLGNNTQDISLETNTKESFNEYLHI